MRANSSFSSLVVVVLALVSGCTPPAEDPAVVVAPPEPLAPEPAPPPGPAPSQGLDDLLREAEVVRSGPSQEVINEIRERPATDRQASTESSADVLAPPVRSLFFQCADDVTFAVRSSGRLLRVFPPGHSNGYIVLTQQPSNDGLHYTADSAELRMKDDLATLELGRDRYVDCISNPAAAVWQEPPRRDPR
jgi:hypothetical protein